jgi:hypothetical protein
MCPMGSYRGEGETNLPSRHRLYQKANERFIIGRLRDLSLKANSKLPFFSLFPNCPVPAQASSCLVDGARPGCARCDSWVLVASLTGAAFRYLHQLLPSAQLPGHSTRKRYPCQENQAGQPQMQVAGGQVSTIKLCMYSGKQGPTGSTCRT